MFEYWTKVHTVDVIDKMDPRIDTGGVGQMILWGVYGGCYHSTTTFYSYLFKPYPLIIFLAYLLAYCLFEYFVCNLDIQLQVIIKDGKPYYNPRMRYGKGKYKYSISHPPPRKVQRK